MGACVKPNVVVGILGWCLVGCAAPTYLSAEQTAPSGKAPGASHRLLSQRADGCREYTLILATGDELATALLEFAKQERVIAARVLGLGAVRGARLGFFDLERKAYRVNEYPEQAEVLSLLGDLGVDESGKPVVHAHLVLSDGEGDAFGGHLISATASPNLELFVTTFPHPLVRRPDPRFGAKFFDLSLTPAAPAGPAK
jgi:predicted DNA-binding protein with PD1-like motif